MSLCVGALTVMTVLLTGCASRQLPAESITVDVQAWKQARFVELTYADNRLTGVDYLDELPKVESKPRRMACLHRDSVTPAPKAISAWIWRSKALMDDPQVRGDFLVRAKQHGVTTLNVQVQRDLTQFDALLRAASAVGVRINALAGEPSDVLDGEPLLRLVDSIVQFNATHRDGFAGVQFDIEPYLLKDYSKNETEVLTRYIELLDRLRRATAGRLELSVAVPFWFADKTLHGESLMAFVAARVDRIAIMSYRTDLPQLLDVANNALCYGELYGKPIDLGLELTKMPRETHYIVANSQLDSSIRTENSKTFLRWDLADLAHLTTRQWVVEPSRLSFYPDTEAAFAMMRLPIPYLSFAGWSINGLDDAWIHP